MIRKAILANCGLLIAAATPAWAQEPARQSDEGAGYRSEGSDIVVTARRREERLQDVPISITALSGGDIEQAGIRNALDLQIATPGLTATASNNDRGLTTFAIRGQRSVEYTLLSDPPIGTYFAEVVQPRAYGFSRTFYDIQSTQILKGVQGTLFGRNMTGGAVLVEPNHPTDEVDAEIAGQYGRFNARQVYGMVNLPIQGEGIALRLAGITRKRDGYATEVTTGRKYENENYSSFRASLQVNPSDAIESLTIFDWYRSNEHASVPYVTAIDTTTTGRTLTTMRNQFLAGRIGTDIVAAFNASRDAFAAKRFNFVAAAGDGSNLDAFGEFPFVRVKNYGVTNKTEFELGDATLKNIFGYRHLIRDALINFSPVAAHVLESKAGADIKSYSEELQLQGKALDGSLDYVTGVYFFKEAGNEYSIGSQFPEITLLGFGLPQTTDARRILLTSPSGGSSVTYAGYAAATYALSNQFKLSAGIRYTHDKRRVHVAPQRAAIERCAFDPDGSGPGPVLPFDQCSASAEASWNALTWDATLQYQPNDGLNVYASVRKGFRAGGFSLRAASDAQLTPYDPEKVLEFEAGLKGRMPFSGGAFTYDAATYLQLYTDIQRQTVVQLPTGDISAIIQNRAKQNNYGGELQLGAQFDNGLSLGLFYAYVAVDVKKYSNGTSTPDGTFELIGMPHHQLGGNIRYEMPMGSDDSKLRFSLDAMYKSRQHLDDRDFEAIEGAYGVVNGRITWERIGGSGFSASLFGTNLTNTFYRSATSGLMDSIGQITSMYGDPRMYGVELKWEMR